MIASLMGYLISAVSFAFGLILLFGWAFEYVPSRIRIMWGAVMLLFAIYRLVATRVRSLQQKRDEE